MHDTQAKLLTMAKVQDLGKLSLRQIAKMIDAEGRPQVVKYHLNELAKKGLIQLDLQKGVIRPVKKGIAQGMRSLFFSLPIVGAANCGPQTIFADERIEGYLKVSAKMLPKRREDLYVLVAQGDSMNQCQVSGGTIEDGDYVVVDKARTAPKDGDVVVAVIDRMATIKRYRDDPLRERIVLEPVSTEEHLPIYIHSDDDFTFSGMVVEVIKK